MGTAHDPPLPSRRSVAATAGAVAVLVAASFAVSRSSPPDTCQAGLLPDRSCTPGVVLTSSKLKVCTPGYAQTVRNVTDATREDVRARYAFKGGRHEIDHLVPLSLGGSNDERNLWPESAPAFRVKDRLEFAAWRAVCAGKLRLRDVQRQFARDWTTVKVPALPTPQTTIP
jgi:hypothetical protein